MGMINFPNLLILNDIWRRRWDSPNITNIYLKSILYKVLDIFIGSNLGSNLGSVIGVNQFENLIHHLSPRKPI